MDKTIKYKQSYSLSCPFNTFCLFPLCKKSSHPGCPGLYLSLSQFISLPQDKLLKFWQILKSTNIWELEQIHQLASDQAPDGISWHLIRAGSLKMTTGMARCSLGPDQKRNCYCQSQSPPLWILIDQSNLLVKHQSKPGKDISSPLLSYFTHNTSI